MKLRNLHRILIVTLVLATALPLASGERPQTEGGWPQWRGPLGTGLAPTADPPVNWSEKQNVRWKIPIPGKGHSTPVVWGDRIFLTTAVPHGEALASEHVDHDPIEGAHDNMSPSQRQKLVVLAINRNDGAIVWQREVRTLLPHETTHSSGSWASHSPVTDGKRVFASFGSGGIYALDVSGELLWKTDLGDMQSLHGHGEGSSPALDGDTLIVNWDHQGGSFVVALDAKTGKEKWRVARDEITSWSTPLIVEHAGKHQVVIAATKRVRAYDLASGEVIWECGGLSGNVVASPVAADGFVYVGSSYETRAMLAIRLAGAKGDITGTDAVVWKRDRDTPYVPSPLLYGDMLCFLKHYQGLLTCVNARSGATLFGPERLPGIRDVYASPVGAAGRIYVVDRSGTTAVIKQSAKFELLAANRLDDSFSASPALAGTDLYLRGEHHLYAIAEGTGGER
jgi:outer membrane protein assembly factor BamB